MVGKKGGWKQGTISRGLYVIRKKKHRGSQDGLPKALEFSLPASSNPFSNDTRNKMIKINP